MACTKPAITFPSYFFLFVIIILLGDFFLPGFAAEEPVSHLQWSSNSPTETNVEIAKKGRFWRWRDRNSRRLMIGSTAPICTYNECRGCKYKCRAEQIPVDANDPINSAYHYRCVCHR